MQKNCLTYIHSEGSFNIINGNRDGVPAAQNKGGPNMKKRLNIFLVLLAALAMAVTMSVSVFAAGISSSDAALKAALKNAGLKKSQVKHIDAQYDKEYGVYEVEFTKKSDGKEYEYGIVPDSGAIVKKEVDYKYKKNCSHKKIRKKAARKKVAKASGVSYKTICKGTCKYNYADKRGTYEIKFTNGNKRYVYKMLAPTGKIMECGWKVKGYKIDL